MSSQKQELSNLLDLVAEFTAVINARIKTDAFLSEKLRIKVSGAELIQYLDLVGFDECTAEDIKTALQANDMFISFSRRVLSDKEHDSELPVTLKRADSWAKLQSLGLDNIAVISAGP
jgi:hypothetical protein